jgi:hypothetical protein
MKKNALIAVVVALVLGAGIASAYHYNTYKNKRDAVIKAQVAAEAAEDKELATLQARVPELVAKYNEQRVNCEKGIASYNSLTVVVRSKLAVPVCGPVIVK